MTTIYGDQLFPYTNCDYVSHVMTPSPLYSSFYIPPIVYNVAFHDDLDNTLAEMVVSNTFHFPFVFFDVFDQ